MLVELDEEFVSEQVVDAPQAPTTSRRWPVAAVSIALILLVGWLLKGTGLKTSVARLLHLQNSSTGIIQKPQSASVAPQRATKSVGKVTGPADPSIQFEKVALPVTEGSGFTCLQVGPDRRLYASADDGRIFRFAIRPDGTLEAPQIITALQDANHGPRLLTGFCFDPNSTADAPILWAAHSAFGFSDMPDWAGKITRVSGPNLGTVEDVIVHLPRSQRDHATFQPSFGPDGALYFAQGSNTALGASDAFWGNRPERLLSASILRLDTNKIAAGHPIDVQTDDGGSYDPYAIGAPLTIYATGLRVAYDLCWASNGHLYAPTNGACAGGSTPAGPGGSPAAMRNVMLDENDWLFKVENGAYYGHPNPRQGHSILNGANPTKAVDPGEWSAYPLGTLPDSQWHPAAYDFGVHVSPNGIIEYRGSAFGGKLDRKLLVCRYNVGADLICLGLDPDGNVTSAQGGITGASDLGNPLDLTEDVSTGNLYVSEYGAQRISLLRPISKSPNG